MAEQYDVPREQRGEQKEEATRSTLKRRGLIAGAAALVTGMMMKQSPQDVAAQGEALVVGNSTPNGNNYQFAQFTTWLAAGPGGQIGVGGGGATFRASNGLPANGPDIKQDGVQGFTVGADNSGVFGRNNELNGVGVWGEAPNGTGVFGDSTGGSGVAGNSSTGAGVYGATSSGYGLYGIVQGSATSIGIFGSNQSSAANSHGIIGQANNGHGLIGSSLGSSAYAGLVGNAGANGADAGAFYGTVGITKDLRVLGNQTVYGTKSAALPLANGKDTHVLVYCVEAPESWLEDFGEGKITNGKADVTLDPKFSAVADTSEIHVFLAPHGDFHAYVSNRHAQGFAAQVTSGVGKAANSAAGVAGVNDTFSYRVVARRKDVAPNRFAAVTKPNMQPPQLDHLPTPPAPPKRREKH